MKTTRATDEKLSQMASRLRLVFTRDHLNEMVTTAIESKMNPREVLQYFFSREIDQREANRIKLSTMAAHFPRVCTLEGFDFSAQPSLDPGVIRDLSQLEWISTGENVMFLGPPGVGKTHLAIALGRQAIKNGYSVLFINAANLMASLEKAQKEGCLLEKIATYNKPKLLIIDEVGYLPFSPNTAHLLFQLVCKRYESKSILLTSNRPVAEWGMIFGDPTVATAILDRLLHHCTPVTIMGDSYRIKANLKSKLLDKN